MSVDPVCGMKVNESQAAATFEYEGTTYYFCSTVCSEGFAAHPEEYAA